VAKISLHPETDNLYTLFFLFISHEATANIWQETYLSAILRAILYSDDSYYRLAGYRKVDPITNLTAEQKFLEAVENLFFKGNGNQTKRRLLT
jgi:hypothetical protein